MAWAWVRNVFFVLPALLVPPASSGRPEVADRSLRASPTRSIMDKASQVLAQEVPPGIHKSYRALADYGNVPHGTLHHRARGRRSMAEKAQSQQYLTPWEESAL